MLRAGERDTVISMSAPLIVARSRRSDGAVRPPPTVAPDVTSPDRDDDLRLDDAAKPGLVIFVRVGTHAELFNE